MSKKALITGISGQDGSYLAEFLLEKGYEVYGVDKSFSQLPSKLKENISQLSDIDLTIPGLLSKLILKIKPEEVYHLAAYHFSSQKDGNKKMSFEPFNSINLLVTNEILETIKDAVADCRFFYASSCHIFGTADHYPQNEKTPYRPDSLYSITKAAGNELCRFYREVHGVYASTGILYNHESPRRSLSFITAQIAEAAARAKLGLDAALTVRNLDSIVDWGASQDYVIAMWMTLQQAKGDDYIISSGVPKSVFDFVKIAFDYVKMDANDYVFQDHTFNKTDSIPYIGDSSKIRKVCGWQPVKPFSTLVKEMVDFQINRLENTK